MTCSVQNFEVFPLYANTNNADTPIVLSNMCGYFEPSKVRHRGLVVSMSDFGTKGQGSIPGWALIASFFSSSFLPL